MNAKYLSEDQSLSLDIITTLPQTIIETILCLLPIEEAARTSILSRNWRYKWTKIPKLEFWAYDISGRTLKFNQPCGIPNARKNVDRRCKLFYVIHHVLLLRQAPIHEFTLYINTDCHCLELDQVILHLSRNHTVKRLTLELNEFARYKLPSCVFSLHHLTDLYLEHCDLGRQPIFTGFGFSSLRSLYLKNVTISTKALLHLLSNCPSLKSSTLLLTPTDLGFEFCTFIELFECLHAVEHLTIRPRVLLFVDLDSVPKELATSLIHLKYFCFQEMCFGYDDGLSFLAELIKRSPNLEKIRLEIHFDEEYEAEICSGISEEYSDIWLEHLTELEIEDFRNRKAEMEFVKFILARSPKLKKVSITSAVEKDQEQLEMLKVLLRAPRASPVEIVVV